MTSLKDVSLALELGINTTIFEGDSKILIKALQEGEPCMGTFRSYAYVAGELARKARKLEDLHLFWKYWEILTSVNRINQF